jgi:hypothetical protein
MTMLKTTRGSRTGTEPHISQDFLDEDDCIRIWCWNEAPNGFTEGLTHGGDEEMILFVPIRMKEQAEWWFDLKLRAGRINSRPYSNKLLHYYVRRVPGGFIISTAHA